MFGRKNREKQVLTRKEKIIFLVFVLGIGILLCLYWRHYVYINSKEYRDTEEQVERAKEELASLNELDPYRGWSLLHTKFDFNTMVPRAVMEKRLGLSRDDVEQKLRYAILFHLNRCFKTDVLTPQKDPQDQLLDIAYARNLRFIMNRNFRSLMQYRFDEVIQNSNAESDADQFRLSDLALSEMDIRETEERVWKRGADLSYQKLRDGDISGYFLVELQLERGGELPRELLSPNENKNLTLEQKAEVHKRLVALQSDACEKKAGEKLNEAFCFLDLDALEEARRIAAQGGVDVRMGFSFGFFCEAKRAIANEVVVLFSKDPFGRFEWEYKKKPELFVNEEGIIEKQIACFTHFYEVEAALASGEVEQWQKFSPEKDMRFKEVVRKSIEKRSFVGK